MKTVKRTRKLALILHAQQQKEVPFDKISFYRDYTRLEVFYYGVEIDRDENFFIMSDGVKLERKRFLNITKTIQ